jgi:hypothetical protein
MAMVIRCVLDREGATAADDATIRREAIRQLGCADACVSRHKERPWTDGRDAPRQLWYGLLIKRTVDAEFELIGRRLTKAALLTMIERFAAGITAAA